MLGVIPRSRPSGNNFRVMEREQLVKYNLGFGSHVNRSCPEPFAEEFRLRAVFQSV